MAEPKTVDPRLELVNFDVLDMDKFPPVEEWTEDDWEEVGLLTLAAMAEEELNRDGWISQEEFEAEFGPLPDIDRRFESTYTVRYSKLAKRQLSGMSEELQD